MHEELIHKIDPLSEIYKIHKDLPSSVYAFFTQLSADEQLVLRILILSKEAQTIRAIRRTIAKYFSVIYLTPEERKNISSPEKFISILASKPREIDLQKKSLIDDMSEREFEKYVSDFNKQHKAIKIPSYQKIRTILESLRSIGVVSQRKGVGKADELWVISPVFSRIIMMCLEEIEKKVPEIIESKKAGCRKSVYEDLYFMLTGRRLIS